MSQTLLCRLCPAGDCEVVVSDDTPLDDMARHGVEVHDLPEDVPWTREMLREAAHDL